MHTLLDISNPYEMIANNDEIVTPLRSKLDHNSEMQMDKFRFVNKKLLP